MGQNLTEQVGSWTEGTSLEGYFGGGDGSQDQKIINQVDELWEKCNLNPDQSLSLESSGPLVKEIFRQ